MWTKLRAVTALTLASAILSACNTIPDPEPVAQAPIIIEVPLASTCFEVTALERVEVPAETRTVVGITLIENPPYDPIEQRTEQKIITKQAEVFYVNTDPTTGNQTEVTNFCDSTIVTGPVGPAQGELTGAPTTG